MPPDKRIRLNVERARVAVVVRRSLRARMLAGVRRSRVFVVLVRIPVSGGGGTDEIDCSYFTGEIFKVDVKEVRDRLVDKLI